MRCAGCENRPRGPGKPKKWARRENGKAILANGRLRPRGRGRSPPTEAYGKGVRQNKATSVQNRAFFTGKLKERLRFMLFLWDGVEATGKQGVTPQDSKYREEGTFKGTEPRNCLDGVI